MDLQDSFGWSVAQDEPVGPQVYRNLRERIIRAELKPGTLISEAEIAKGFALSRQPVREAFIKLAEQGLVEVRPQRGTLVRKIRIASVMDARFVREAVEADIVKLVAAASSPALVKELRRQLRRQRATAEEHPSEFMKLDEIFHKTLAEAVNKEHVWSFVDTVKAQMDRVRYLTLMHRTVIKVAIDQHEAIIDAIERGAEEEADSAMRLHLRAIITDLPDVAKQKPEFFEED